MALLRDFTGLGIIQEAQKICPGKPTCKNFELDAIDPGIALLL